MSDSQALQLTCPECHEKVNVRRVWLANVTANVLIDAHDLDDPNSPFSAYPANDDEIDIDETLYKDCEHGEFYCAQCGATIAKDIHELREKVKEEPDGA